MKEGIDLCSALTGFPLSRVVVFDTETTGTSPYSRDEILSIAICDGTGKQLFNSLVKPTKNSSWPEAERINGISPSMVKDAPTLAEITPQIREHLLGNKLIVGYNVSFDVPFLIEGKALEEWPRSTFDVMREYASVHGSRRSRYGDGFMYSKLVDCARSYGYEFDAHDALEDARATAFCFRALICDEAYVRPRMKQRLELLKRFSVTQTKSTTDAVHELIEGGMTSSVRAELRLGEVTRGKTKGTPRYECFIEDRCVGVSSPDSVAQIRKIYALGDSATLPKRVPCKALLSAAGEKASCEVTITARGKVLDEVLEAAKTARAQNGVEYREATVPAKQSNAKPMSGADHPNDMNESPSVNESRKQSSGSGIGCGGCLTMLILVIVILCVIGLVTSGQ